MSISQTTRNVITIIFLVLSPLLGILVMWLISRWSKKVKLAITLALIGLIIFFILIPAFIYLFIAQPFKVSGKAMYPGLNDQEYILVKKLWVDNSPIKRGEIITFTNPRNSSQIFIKRAVGLPGESLKILNNEVYINGERLNETYLDNSVQTPRGTFLIEDEEIVIPVNHYFVLGDNRVASSDSREFGLISKENIIGRYWLSYQLPD